MTTETLPFFASSWWVQTRALWQRLARLSRRTPRRLRLRESLPLGEHRFVAVIEFEQRRLLIGGTPSSLVLLAHLDAGPTEKSAFPDPQPAGVPPEERKLRDPKERTEERKREAL